MRLPANDIRPMLPAPDPVTVVTVRNVFKYHEREVAAVPYKSRTVGAYVAHELIRPGVDLVVNVNGREVPAEAWGEHPIAPGDFIGVVPVLADEDTKPFIAIIATIILMIVANKFGLAAGSALLEAVGASSYTVGFASTLGTTLIYAAGSMLINAVIGPQKADTSQLGLDAWNESPTYSWGSLYQVAVQGNPLQIVYGSHRMAGQTMSKFLSIKDNKEFLNIMLGVAGHEVTSIDEIEINNQPASTFENVTTATRLGTLSDTAIEGFDEIPFQQPFTSLLHYDTPVEKTTDGNAVEAIEVELIAPYGAHRIRQLWGHRLGHCKSRR